MVAKRPAAIVVSPGPGRPARAGRTLDEIAAAEREDIPLLGVCLGHQAIAALHGGRVERAPAPRHGMTSPVLHGGGGLFAGMTNPFDAGRYHSLVVKEEGLPSSLAVTARTPDGIVMALSHRSRRVFGVQFHPESVLTPEGEILLGNFVALAREGRVAESRP